MIEQDIIKEKALVKLDRLVRERIKYYEDTNDTSELSNIYPLDENYFTPEENKEIDYIVMKINSSLIELNKYCINRNIDLPYKFRQIIELIKKKCSICKYRVNYEKESEM